MELFKSSDNTKEQPLAFRMRPRTLDEYAGQDHIVGKGRLLRRMIQADQLSSLIFYGPPGTGKTTLARVIAHTTKSTFTTMNAVLSGVKNLREEIEKSKERYALYQKKTILFVDEIHRWNKAQQDALLPWVENGTIILIGATTENPFFEVNSALVSRSRVFQLKPLLKDNLFQIAKSAIFDSERGYGRFKVKFLEGALDHLIDIANGDARSLLNAIQLAVETTPKRFPPPEGEEILISMKTAEESIQKKVVLYDKEGDYHFDVISAFIKSIRGSDPDAVLYWLAKMVHAGEDPRFMFRRMLISASEDIGLADPAALGIVTSAAAAFDRVGMPEGRFHLTQAALYLATAPKSNSALGFFDALKAVEGEETGEVPNRLRDGARDKEGFGHGKGYQYPHAYQNHWVPQQYLPDSLAGETFYTPSDCGYEKTIRQEVIKRREINLEITGTPFPEILSTKPVDQKKDIWINRLTSGYNTHLAEIRDSIFSKAVIAPHHKVLVINPGNGLLLWEACRKVTSGLVSAIPGDRPLNPAEYNALITHASGLPEFERPQIHNTILSKFTSTDGITYERIIGMNVLTREKDKRSYLKHIKELTSPGGIVVLSEVIPSKSTRLTELLMENLFTTKEWETLLEAENEIYNSARTPLTGCTAEDLKNYFIEAGFSQVEIGNREYLQKRLITKGEISRWFSPSSSVYGYGDYLSEKMGAPSLDIIRKKVSESLSGKEVPWKLRVCPLSATRPISK